MSEFRQNFLTGEWTVYAVGRKKRPYEFERMVKPKYTDTSQCPFCCGNEEKTTSVLYQDRPGAEWTVRVFPNLYPTVCPTDHCGKKQEGLFQAVGGIGQHEVLVDTPVHTQRIHSFDAGHLKRVLSALQMRSAKMKEEKYIRYVQIFKNNGPEAGMSISHSHWQIVGLPLIPSRVGELQRHMLSDKGCLVCQMLQQELEKQVRVCAENASFVALAPFASRFPYEVSIFPKQHQASFSQAEEAQLTDLANLLLPILTKTAALQNGETGYNICLMDAPKGEDFHWHMEILPRIGGFAGFEYATDTYINSVLPEETARYFQKK